MIRYVPMALKANVRVNVGEKVVTLPFFDIAEGCAGYILVFDSKEAAEKWADGKFKIMEIEEKEYD